MLDVFNFKEDFKRWVKVFRNDISRQGCPLSGLLVLGIQLLNLAIQTNSNIKGIKVGYEEIKNTLYADDTTLFV